MILMAHGSNEPNWEELNPSDIKWEMNNPSQLETLENGASRNVVEWIFGFYLLLQVSKHLFNFKRT